MKKSAVILTGMFLLAGLAMSPPALSSVCFAGDGCDENLGVNKDPNEKYERNDAELCKEAGYDLPNCRSVETPMSKCPYDDAYTVGCVCRKDLVSCSEAEIGVGESCDGKYASCQCKTGLKSCNKAETGVGASCTTKGVTKYVDCICKSDLLACDGDGQVGNGDSCGGKYTACKCNSNWGTCSNTAPATNAKRCVYNGTTYYSSCKTAQELCSADGYPSSSCKTYETISYCPRDSRYVKCTPTCKSRIKAALGYNVAFDSEYSSAKTRVVTNNISNPSGTVVRSHISYASQYAECRSMGSTRPKVTFNYYPAGRDIQDVDVSITYSINTLGGRLANSTLTFPSGSVPQISNSYKFKLAGSVTINATRIDMSDTSPSQKQALLIANNANVKFNCQIGGSKLFNTNGNYSRSNDYAAFARRTMVIGTNATVNISGDVAFIGNKQQQKSAIIVGKNSTLRVTSGAMMLRETELDVLDGAKVYADIYLDSTHKSRNHQQGGMYLFGTSYIYSKSGSLCYQASNASQVLERTHQAGNVGLIVKSGCGKNSSCGYKNPNNFDLSGTPNCSISPDGLPSNSITVKDCNIFYNM